MRYVEIDAGKAVLREGPEPQPPPGWARVKVLACGVCGTDVHLLHGMVLPPELSYPLRPGHEVAGIVEEVSGRARVKEGDLVVLHPLATCGRCDGCRRGQDQLCESARILGMHEPGGLAESVVWPADRMLPANGIAPAEAAILADAGATAYHAVERAAVPKGGALCVLGAGGVGTQVLEVARAVDPDIQLAAVVRSAASAERIRDAGVTVVQGLEGAARTLRQQLGRFHAVVDFTGDAAAPAEAVKLLHRGGRLVLGSVVDEPLVLGPSSTVLTRELQLAGAYVSSIDDLAAVIELLQSGQVDLSGAVSHRYPLAEAHEAIEAVAQRPPGLVRLVVERDAA